MLIRTNGFVEVTFDADDSLPSYLSSMLIKMRQLMKMSPTFRRDGQKVLIVAYKKLRTRELDGRMDFSRLHKHQHEICHQRVNRIIYSCTQIRT